MSQACAIGDYDMNSISNTPLVSVIIPFYNNKQWLSEAIESVYSQTYSNYEVILVNDGSKEEISDLLSAFPTIKYFHQNNSGAGSARNKGIEAATGKYIAFLDSDDLWLPNKLSIQVDYMENNPDIVWSHCSYETFGYGESKIMTSSDAKGEMFPKCFCSCRIATPCVIIKSDIMKENTHLRFNEDMRFGQDFYLWVLLAKTYPLGNIENVLAKVRMRGSNAAKRAFVMLKAKSELAEKLKKSHLIEWDSLPLLIRFAYKLSDLGYKLICRFDSFLNESVKELLSKFLYVVPFLILRIEMQRYKD